MIYVTMTDKFMSGWGLAEGKVNKLIFECDNINEAKIVADNATYHGSMTNIRTYKRMPKYNSLVFYTQIKNKEVYPNFYKQDSFYEPSWDTNETILWLENDEYYYTQSRKIRKVWKLKELVKEMRLTNREFKVNLHKINWRYILRHLAE